MFDSKLLDEEGRLAALHRYGVLDTPREKPFDKITSLVQRVLGVPICAVSLVDRDRQWFKSIQGLEAAETPRSVSFCSHTIQTREPLIVPDALADDRFRSNGLVTGEPRIRSYAGVPLRTPDGYNLGSLCAIDQQPREFSEAQIGILKSFASGAAFYDSKQGAGLLGCKTPQAGWGRVSGPRQATEQPKR